jgi:hypothetical protein
MMSINIKTVAMCRLPTKIVKVKTHFVATKSLLLHVNFVDNGKPGESRGHKTTGLRGNQ